MSVAQRQYRWTLGIWGVLMLVVMWATPGRTAEFRIAVGVAPDTMDPAQLTTTIVANMVDYVVETLTKLVPAKQVWHEAPWIFLWVQHFPIVHSARVAGIGSLPNEKCDALYAQPAQ